MTKKKKTKTKDRKKYAIDRKQEILPTVRSVCVCVCVKIRF